MTTAVTSGSEPPASPPPLAAQVHALRAAAAFIEQAGIAGLSLTIGDDHHHPGARALAGPPAAPRGRGAGAPPPAARRPATPPPGRTHGWISADGQVAGHPVRIFTAIEEATP